MSASIVFLVAISLFGLGVIVGMFLMSMICLIIFNDE